MWDTPANYAEVENYQIYFSKDSGETWSVEAGAGGLDTNSINLSVFPFTESATYNRVKIVSQKFVDGTAVNMGEY